MQLTDIYLRLKSTESTSGTTKSGKYYNIYMTLPFTILIFKIKLI